MAQYGTNWAATDWYCEQRQKVYFTYKADVSKRQFIVTAYQTTECKDSAKSPTYYVCKGTQYWTINGSKHSMVDHIEGIKYRGFADNGSWLDVHYNGKTYPDYNGDYLGIRRDLVVYGTNWGKYTFRVDADANGVGEFSVSGDFAWFNGTRRKYSKTFTIKDNNLKKQYTIKFNSNKSSIKSPTWKQNIVSNMPSNLTKKHNESKSLSNKIPTCTNNNYTFVCWEDRKNNKTYNPGATFKLNDNITLYAKWAPKNYKTTFDFGDYTTRTSSKNSIDGKYASSITTPSATYYGRTLDKWVLQENSLSPSQHNSSISVSPTSKYTVWGTGTLTPQFVNNYYTFKLVDKNGEKLRTVSCQYNNIVKGNFSYNISGYDCIGWSTTSMPILYPDVDIESISVVANNLNYKDNKQKYKNKLFIGNGDYSSSSYKLPNGQARTSHIGEDITLYPILRYKTSMYVYTSEGWKLAMPYVYSDGKWNMALGYIKDSNSNWKL